MNICIYIYMYIYMCVCVKTWAASPRRCSDKAPPRAAARSDFSTDTCRSSHTADLRPFHQKSTDITQLTLRPCVVQLWSRDQVARSDRSADTCLSSHTEEKKLEVVLQKSNPTQIRQLMHRTSTQIREILSKGFFE